MEAKAVVRYVRMSPQKARLVVDLVRGKKVGEALNILRFTNKAIAKVVGKLIASAKANAENSNVGDADTMVVEKIFVDQGPVMKRRLARSRGRVDTIRKPFSHITVILREVETSKKRKAEAPKKGAAETTAGKEAVAKEAKPAAGKTKAASGTKKGTSGEKAIVAEAGAKKTKTTKKKGS